MSWFHGKKVSGDQNRMCVNVFDPCDMGGIEATTQWDGLYGCF